MKIVLTGANGQVGREIVLRAAHRSVLAFSRSELDITDVRTVESKLTDCGADLVINAAAYTAVDRAEQETEQAYAVNRDGVSHLAVTCARLNIPLLHISTDYVFDGSKSGAYLEDDPIAPLGVYGASKWQGEQVVRNILEQHIILRVSWVFGAYGHNFVKTMLRLARERDELRVVDDQCGCPTYAGAIAAVLLNVADRISDGDKAFWGTYHFCGSPATTWHGFAKAIVEQARTRENLKTRLIVPIATADYPTPAARPANSVLDCTKLRKRFGIESTPWRQGLEAMLTTA